jgi:hypothetical protein
VSAAKTLRDRVKHWQRLSREPGLTALLILQVALIFLAIPLAGMGVLPEMLLPVMFALLVIATIVVTWQSHVATIVVLLSVSLSPIGSYLHARDPTILTDWLSTAGRLVAIAALTVVIARVVFGSGRVSLHRVQGAVVLYLNFGLFFFTIYRLMDVLLPNAFSGLPQTGQEYGSGASLLYFSFSTLTTLGYGDIEPVQPLVRNLANLEAIVGQLYPATLLARLVSLQIEHRRHSRTNGRTPTD